MTSLFVELARTTLGLLLIAYTIVAISHFLLQLRYAHRTYRRQGSAQFALDYPGIDVAVDILVPVYNEDPVLLEACLASAVAQDHGGPIQLVVVDDGSPNRAALDAIYDRYEELGARIVRSPTNVGKRRAQALGLGLCSGEILVTLDSDSVLKPDAVRMLTRQFADPKIGAATGFVDVSNRTANLLTRIQRVRYWMAFNQERAAQTWFRTVMCCSGPLAAYRRAIVESVRGAYLSQTYGGVECTYGDDRHLTNLILGQGYDTVYDSGAVALTNVPTSVGGFLRQQLRWNKSFYRELIWTMPYIGTRPWYSRLDVACQVAMPVLLTITAGSALILGVLSSPLYLARYIAFIAIAAMLRSTYAVLRERDLRFYLFVLYGYISAFLLMSVRLRALATLTDARWGTRGPVAVSRAGEAVAGLVASLQPLRVAPQSMSWPAWRPARRWSGGAARLDGAWRAGNRTRMMANPPTPGDVSLPAVMANLVVVGSASAHQLAPGWEMTPPDPSARLARHAVAGTRTPTYVSPLPPGHHLHPIGAWRIGPTCQHAAAANGTPFCPACGSRPGPVFDATGQPLHALRDRMDERRAARAARAAATATVATADSPTSGPAPSRATKRLTRNSATKARPATAKTAPAKPAAAAAKAAKAKLATAKTAPAKPAAAAAKARPATAKAAPASVTRAAARTAPAKPATAKAAKAAKAKPATAKPTKAPPATATTAPPPAKRAVARTAPAEPAAAMAKARTATAQTAPAPAKRAAARTAPAEPAAPTAKAAKAKLATAKTAPAKPAAATAKAAKARPVTAKTAQAPAKRAAARTAPAKPAAPTAKAPNARAVAAKARPATAKAAQAGAA